MSYLPRFPKNSPELSNFKMPFVDHLDAGNELVRLAHLIPWAEIEALCLGLFPQKGRRAIPVRIAVGAILLKELRPIGGDRPLVQMIKENPYAQYFLGFSEFQVEAPFHHTQMSYFRERLSDKMSQINDLILKAREQAVAKKHDDDKPQDHQPKADKPQDDQPEADKPTNSGKLVIDATVAPADIAYPTDCALVDKAIEKAGKVIDSTDVMENVKRPYDNRDKMHSVFLEMAKARRMTACKRRARMRLLVDFLGKQLDYIDICLERPQIAFISATEAEYVAACALQEVLRTLHTQQDEMLNEKKHTVKDRIVSIAQPWVRPIARGKLRAKTEFGIKISASVVDGYVRFEDESFDPYNESTMLPKEVERYRKRYGFYPESLHVDQIYMTRNNRDFCKEHGIRISGRPLGRRPKDETKKKVSDEQYKTDLKDRIIVEGKIGEAKRNHSLDRVMAHLKATTLSVLHAVAAVMNLKRWLRSLRPLLCLLRNLLFWRSTPLQPVAAVA